MSDAAAAGPTPRLPEPEVSDQPVDAAPRGDDPTRPRPARRRRGTRGGRGRNRPRAVETPGATDAPDDIELPERASEGKVLDPEVAEQVLVRRPRIGDTRPAPTPVPSPATGRAPAKKRGDDRATKETTETRETKETKETKEADRRRRRRGGRGRTGPRPEHDHTHVHTKATSKSAAGLFVPDPELRKGRERKGRPVGRYLMGVHVRAELTQIAVLEGRALIEHYVSRPSDGIAQIHGNIYLGKVQNVLPGMEAAFVDIGTPKNAVLYSGDVQYDAEDLLEGSAGGRRERPRIEDVLRPRQTILSQVTKNPIGAKGARLTQEVSIPGRFVVLIPNSRTYGISKRLGDDERKRLRGILDKVKPAEHGVIVRTAAENVVEDELRRDVERLLGQWQRIEAQARKASAPSLLYREMDMAVRVIREEFNREYRGIVLDDLAMYEEVREYVASISPDLADRVEYYDPEVEGLPLFEHLHVHEQLHKALDRKVWLPSGGSLIIEHAEALTVIDVNTGKNVGSSNLEETVFNNNLEAANEIAHQLRLRDIGGIIVIDFIDMEIRENRHKVVAAFREALARDKTRTQVFDISELGLVEMTRKRIGEGLLTSYATTCPMCEGRGLVVDHDLLD